MYIDFPRLHLGEQLTPGSCDTSETVEMFRSGTCPNYNASYSPSFVPVSVGKQICIADKALAQNSQIPICGLVLANMAHDYECYWLSEIGNICGLWGAV